MHLLSCVCRYVSAGMCLHTVSTTSVGTTFSAQTFTAVYATMETYRAIYEGCFYS